MLVRKITPNKINELKENEIFVFGSNLKGHHTGGAAKLAKQNFGAEEGVGEGLTGQSYALPTLDKDMNKVSLKALSDSIDKLYQFAESHKRLDFWVTKIGCGIAGFSENEVAAIFKSKETPYNVYLPKEFTVIKGFKGFKSDMKCRGFQYKENTEFTHDGRLEVCSEGLHFCENPLNVLRFYNSVDGVYAEVEGGGEMDNEARDSKWAVSKLNIHNKIQFMDFINLSLQFTLKKVNWLIDRAAEKLSTPLDWNVLAGHDYSTLVGHDYNTLAGHSNNTLVGHSNNTIAGHDYNTIAGHLNNTLAGDDYNTLAGQDYNTIAGRDGNVLVGRDGNVLAGRDYNTIAGQDYNTLIGYKGSTLIGRDGNVLVGRDGNILATQDNNVLAGRDGNVLATQDNNVLATQDSNVLTTQDDNILATQDNNFVATQDNNVVAGHDYSTLSGKNINVMAAQNDNTLAVEDSNIISCKYKNTITITGKDNIVTCANGSKVKCTKGNIVVFVEFDTSHHIVHHKVIRTNGKNLKENCFYTFEEGKVIKVD